MKTSRVPRGGGIPKVNSDSERNTPRPRSPVWQLPAGYTVFPQLSPQESSVLKGSNNKTPRPVTARADTGAAIQAEADMFRQSAQKMQNESRAKLKSLPFNLAYIPPTNHPHRFTDVYENQIRPVTARPEVSRKYSNTSTYKNFIGPEIRTMERKTTPSRITETSSAIGDGGLSSRRAKKKAPSINAKPGTASTKSQASASDCTIDSPRSSRSADKELQLNFVGARRLPDWLISLADRGNKIDSESLEFASQLKPPTAYTDRQVRVKKESSSPRIVTVNLGSPPIDPIALTSRREPKVPSALVKDVSGSSSLVNNASSPKGVGVKKKKLPSTNPTAARKSSSVLVTKSSTSLQEKKPILSLLAKKSTSAEAMQSAAKAKFKTEAKGKAVPQNLQTKSVEEKQHEKSSYSKNIRSAVNSIKELSHKRMLESPKPSAVTGVGNLKEKDGTAGKPKTKKFVLKARANKKQALPKTAVAMTKTQTLRNRFLGSQYQIVDHQLRNLFERQRALEREVLVFFDSLQKTFCEESCCSHCSHGPKCCCNAETQEKMKALLQKQKEVIQLQVDLRKRYGIDHYGPASKVGLEEPILNGFNAHFGELISHVREIDGKMVYYCAVCNVACDDELAFRRHLENTKHVVKTCKGIQNTQPLYTCDDCETKCRGATKYMSHVISNNFHKSEQLKTDSPASAAKL